MESSRQENSHLLSDLEDDRIDDAVLLGGPGSASSWRRFALASSAILAIALVAAAFVGLGGASLGQAPEIADVTQGVTGLTLIAAKSQHASPIPRELFGKYVFIASHRGERLEDLYGNAMLSANSDTEEMWTLSDAGDGKLFITSSMGQQLEDVRGTPKMSPRKQGWEAWTLQDAGEGKVFITSSAGLHLSDANGNLRLVRNALEWETWTISEANSPQPNPPTTPPKDRLGSFLVIGDWGWDQWAHGNLVSSSCQQAIANKMLSKMNELGDVKFVVNVGDSFYPNGLSGKDDPQWDTKWRDVYPSKVRSVPWYSVYGNHDYHLDPGVCSSEPNAGAQINDDVNDLSRFYMPSYNWFREHPELNLEVLGLDLNKFQEGWQHQLTYDQHNFADCQWTHCKDQCHSIVEDRTVEAFKLFGERMEQSTAKNLLVFSHYPTDYFSAMPKFVQNLSRTDRHSSIAYFGGHRHNTDKTSVASTAPNTNWCVGGGGGWSCDGQEQGFVVGEIYADEIKTYEVLVDPSVCCPSRQSY